MDLATLIGFIVGLVCLVISILLGGSLLAFYDVSSIFIVLGGGMASVLISYRIGEIAKVMKVVINAFVGKEADVEKTVSMLVEFSQKARREGLLALESEFDRIEDEFVKQALQMVVDGIEPDVIKEFMDIEISNMQARHNKGQSIFKTMGALFPAWGMIGTLIGLINLLKSLNDPSKIGPAMAVALITTFYGSVLANFVCIPIANKLKLKSDEEIRQKEMVIEGIISIHQGENPKIMETKLKLFVPPDKRNVQPEQANSNMQMGQ